MNKKVSLIFVIFLVLNFCTRAQEKLNQNLEMIKNFGQIYSELRYYYPDNTLTPKQWDLALIKGIKMLENTSVENYADSINKFLSFVAPLSKISSKKTNFNFHCFKNEKKAVFWQHKGFKEEISGTGSYQSRLIHVNSLKGFPGLIHWLDERLILENSTIELSLYAQGQKHNKLNLSIEAYDEKLKIDSTFSTSFNLSPKWQQIKWKVSYNQNKSFITTIIGLGGKGTIRVKDFIITISLKDTIIKENLVFNYEKVRNIPRVNIRYPYGYEYDIDSSLKTLSITKNKKQNANWLFNAPPSKKQWAEIKINDTLFLYYPTSIKLSKYKKRKKSLSFDMPFANENDIITNKFASLIKVFAVIDNFFPYQEQINYHSNRYLTKYLLEMDKANKEIDIFNVIVSMIAELKDGHGYVEHPIRFKSRCADADFGVFENKLVVISAVENYFLKKGDIVLEVNNKDAIKVLEERTKFRSGSEQWKISREVLLFSCGDSNIVDIYKIKRNNDTLVGPLIKKGYAGATIKPNLEAICFLKDSIIYVDLSRMTYAQIQTKFDLIDKSKGIIFDMREYPKMTPDLLAHLTKTELRSALWENPIRTAQQRVLYDTSGTWEIAPRIPYLNQNIVFLIGPNTISYGESLTEIIDFYKLGTTIGQTTAGVNGNKTSFTAPGGYTVHFTGMKVNRKNGEQLFGKGIKPNEIFINKWNDSEDELIEFARKYLVNKL